MSKTVTLLSMLHEPAERNSATRLFRGEPVLAWTLRRLELAKSAGNPVVLCWEEQAQSARACAAEICSRGPRQALAAVETVASARRWADGWRGGLLGTCEFDRGFYGPWAEEICREQGADRVLLVDPAAGLVDAELIDSLIAHADGIPDLDLCFSQAAPGLSGVLVSAKMLEQLSTAKQHPGILLSYRPDSPRRDPISEPACAPIPVRLARTVRRFSLDSNWQIERMASATSHLNGQLITTRAMNLLELLEKSERVDASPRELVMELTTRRATSPVYLPRGIERSPMTLAKARPILAELAKRDDARLLLAGVGDPLLCDDVLKIIAEAQAAGIAAIAVETDFVGLSPELITGLAESAVDIVTVHVPAATAVTYREVMGADTLASAISAMQLFIQKRQEAGRQTPLLAPAFTKCRQNQDEMEPWYDHWIRTVGCAVVSGASDFAGLIPDASAADMSPPRRRACASLWKRLMVLSDGRIVSCEQDVTGRQALGASLSEAWKSAEKLRRDHLSERWCDHADCAACKEWHRP